MRVEAAEEDAALALDLAKQNATSCEEMEGWLNKAMSEIDMLRKHVAAVTAEEEARIKARNSMSPSRSVRFADQAECEGLEHGAEATVSPPSASRPSRALVAAGRQLLQRSFSPRSDSSPHMVHLSTKDAAERRNHLKNRLKSLDVAFNVPSSDPTVPESPSRSPHLGSAIEALDVCRNTARILKESGRRLNLTGRWWSGHSDTVSDEIHLETLARHYCASVEVSAR
jgi:hypothetical protein